MNRIKILLFPIAIILFTVGCSGRPPEEIRTPTKAHQKLIKLCKEEYNLDIITKAFDNTLWIYLPLNNAYLYLTASKGGPKKSDISEEEMFLKYIDGEFKDNTFHLDYDIRKNKTYTDSKGIGTRTTEEYSKKQQFLLSAINRAYGDIEQKPDSEKYVEKVPGDVTFMDEKKNAAHKKLVHSYVKTDEVPDFFVIIIADIATGIETRIYLYLQDLQRAFVDQAFSQEYVNRVITDQPIGHDVIIGDKTGKHLNVYDITWPEFLAKQMVHRITFKYTQSAFPPSENTKEEILKMAAETVGAYEFTDFAAIHLNDLDTDTLHAVTQEELADYRSEPTKGRLIHIKFR